MKKFVALMFLVAVMSVGAMATRPGGPEGHENDGPEIDPATGAAAMALILGTVAVMRARRKT